MSILSCDSAPGDGEEVINGNGRGGVVFELGVRRIAVGVLYVYSNMAKIVDQDELLVDGIVCASTVSITAMIVKTSSNLKRLFWAEL